MTGKSAGNEHCPQLFNKGTKLERETDSRPHHSEIVAVTIYDIPVEIVNDPNVGCETNFEAAAELAHRF